MIQSKALECPICYQEYDLEQRMPMVLVDCGHTICQYCLNYLINEDDSKCPLDKKAFRRKDISLFPVNFSLKGVIEENLEWDRCKQDGEKIEFICKTDKCRVCLGCWHHDKHQGHVLISVDDAKAEFENKRQELESALKMINDYYKEIDAFLDCRKEYLWEQIEKRVFGQKEMQIRYRKLALLFDLSNYINYEKCRLVCTLNYGFNLKHDIFVKLKKLNEIQSKTPWDLFDSCVIELALRAQKVLERRNYQKVISKRVSEVEDHLEFLIIASHDQEEEASFNTGYLNLLSWFHERCPEEEENSSMVKMSEVKTSPLFSIDSSTLSHIGLLIKISSSFPLRNQQNHEFTLQEENALTIVIEVNSGIAEKDLETLYMIRWHLKHIKTLNLVLNNVKKGPFLLNIISILYLFLDKVDKIFLIVHCQYKTNLDDLFLLLKDKFLGKISPRANLCLYFEFVETSTAAFKNFVKSAKKIWASQFSLQKEGNMTKVEVGSVSKDRDLNDLLSFIPERTRYFNFIQNYGYPYYYTDLYEDIEEYEYVDYEF